MGEEVFIDSNIFLEIFLMDNKSEECKKFLKSLQEQNDEAVTSDFIMYSCILQVQTKLKDIKLVRNTIAFFNLLPNLRILRPFFEEFYAATKIMEERKLDFDDGLVIACMEAYGIKKLATLDKHFDKIKWIERVKL